jgi:hypothetical protein
MFVVSETYLLMHGGASCTRRRNIPQTFASIFELETDSKPGSLFSLKELGMPL